MKPEPERPYPAIDRAQRELEGELRAADARHPHPKRGLRRLRTPVALLAVLAVCVPAGLAVAHLTADDGRPVTEDGTPVPDGPLGIEVINDAGEVVTCPDGEPLVASRAEAAASLEATKSEGGSELPMPRCADGSVPDDATGIREAYIDEDGERIPTRYPTENP